MKMTRREFLKMAAASAIGVAAASQMPLEATKVFAEGNDDSAPLCVQDRIVNVEPRLIKIAYLTYNYVEEKGFVDQPLDKWLYEYLYSASHLAIQYFLEQEWNS